MGNEIESEKDKLVRTFLTITLVTSGVLLAGCGTGYNELTLDTVGPVPAQALTAAPPGGDGTLVVYSAYKRNADFDSRDPRRQEYSDYRILTADGRPFQSVHNNSGTILEDPVSVTLAPGKYRVIARANGYGYVTVPVIVEARQTTILHLEGGGSWPDTSVFNQTNAVRLPDGKIVGWRTASNF